MPNFNKLILYEIAVHLNCNDLLNFCLTCKKLFGIFNDEYFWRKKRMHQYPHIEYSEAVTFSEKTKYKNIRASGYLYEIYQGNTNEYLINGQRKLVKKIIVFQQHSESGWLVLTYDGDLYNIDHDTFSEKHIYLCGNVADMYYRTYEYNVYIQDEEGNIKKFQKYEIADIWNLGNVKKFQNTDEYNFILTKNDVLYIKDTNNCIVECFYDIKDFSTSDRFLYLDTNGKLWYYPKYNQIYQSTYDGCNDKLIANSNDERTEPLLLCDNVKHFSTDSSSDNLIMIIDKHDKLFEFKYPADVITLSKIDDDVDFMKHTCFYFFYIKNRVELYKRVYDVFKVCYQRVNIGINNIKRIIDLEYAGDTFCRDFVILQT